MLQKTQTSIENIAMMVMLARPSSRVLAYLNNENELRTEIKADAAPYEKISPTGEILVVDRLGLDNDALDLTRLISDLAGEMRLALLDWAKKKV